MNRDRSVASHVTLTLNGAVYELTSTITVTELLASLEIDPRRVAVELNLVVIKRTQFDNVWVQSGDEVEIVNIVGGG